MLKTRVVTAIFLLAIFLLALFYFSPSGWIAFVTLIAALAAWEWGALMGFRGFLRVFLGVMFALICVVISALEPAALGLESGFSESAWDLGRWFYIPAAIFWLFGVPLWMRFNWSLPKSFFGVMIGVLLIAPTWLALVQLKQVGTLPLIAIMATVWLADIAAYGFGRILGRHKLAPSISPGKTWEGVLGGGFAVIIYGFFLSPKLPRVLSDNPFLLLLALILLTAISVIGDLFESMLKRQSGLKDSSNILPGHGGVLDRIDSLTSTLPIVALIWLMTLLN